MLLAVSGLVASSAWFLSEAGYFARSLSSREGTLIVNVNTATQDELETPPGIGPALAQLVIAAFTREM